MKKILLSVILLCAMMSAQAQKLASGSLSELRNNSRINVELDFHDALLDGLSEPDFAAAEPKWDLAQKELWQKFISEINEAMHKKTHAICGHFEGNITLKFKILSIEGRGDLFGLVYVLDADGNELAIIRNVKGEGGHFGSFYNLAGDGIRDAGERLGKFLAKSWYK